MVTIVLKDNFYDFKFFGSVKARQPSEEEAAGLVQTLDVLFSELLFNRTDNPFSTRVTLANVEYCLQSEASLAGEYNMRMLFDLRAEFGVGCRKMATKEELMTILRDFDMDLLLKNYIWKSQPLDENIFHATELAKYDITRACRVSSVPSISATSLPENGTLPSVVIRDVFLELGFSPDTYLRDLVPEEVDGLAQQTELFLTGVLGTAYNFPTFFLRFSIHDVTWCYVEPQAGSPLRMHFNGLANFDFGMDLPSPDEVFGVIQNSLAFPSNFSDFNSKYLAQATGPSNSYDPSGQTTKILSGATHVRIQEQQSHRCGR